MITINKSVCDRCGICIANCPMSIITENEEQYPELKEENKMRCVKCGHCEAVCPHEAIDYSYPENYAQPMFTGKVKLDEQELSLYMQTRRSIRNYKNKTVEQGVIDKLMDIVRYAPTGINSQSVKWLIVHDTEKVKRLAEASIDFMRMVVKVDPDKAAMFGFPGMIRAVENGVPASKLICRNAPHLALTYVENGNFIGMNDSIIATTHFDLAAPVFGLGTCWAGYLTMAFQQMPLLNEIVGLDKKYSVRASLMFGYPQFKYQKTPARKKADVTII